MRNKKRILPFLLAIMLTIMILPGVAFAGSATISPASQIVGRYDQVTWSYQVTSPYGSNSSYYAPFSYGDGCSESRTISNYNTYYTYHYFNSQGIWSQCLCLLGNSDGLWYYDVATSYTEAYYTK